MKILAEILSKNKQVSFCAIKSVLVHHEVGDVILRGQDRPGA